MASWKITIFNRRYIFKCVFISHGHGSFRGVYTCCLWLDNFPMIIVHWKICPFFVEGRIDLMHSWVKVRYVQSDGASQRIHFYYCTDFSYVLSILILGGQQKIHLPLSHQISGILPQKGRDSLFLAGNHFGCRWLEKHPTNTPGSYEHVLMCCWPSTSTEIMT